LLVASKGGGFILCASYEDLNGFYEFLVKRHNSRGEYALRRQTSASTIDSDIAWFKETPRSVLLGAKSLWEGVDVPGLGLRLVIIPRLPFPSRSDVVLNARKTRYIDLRVQAGANERGAGIESFNHFDLQEMLMDIKQGGGRLIRSESDWGTVAILDPRAYGTAKGYSSKVRASLPMKPTYDKALTLKFSSIIASRAGL
jgi:ATP-dependent DNA helicase DinG